MLFQRKADAESARTTTGESPGALGWLSSHSCPDEPCARISCSSIDLTCVFNKIESTQILIDKNFKLNF
jgi:hypothetical protein